MQLSEIFFFLYPQNIPTHALQFCAHLRFGTIQVRNLAEPHPSFDNSDGLDDLR